MGATLWHYRIPYEESLEEALAVLRKRLLREGEFTPPAGMTRADVVGLPLMELLQATEGDGTHSALDLPRVGAWGTPGVIAVPPDHVVEQWFGTATPQAASIAAAAITDVASQLGRWHGAAVPLHEGSRPTEWLVVGVSGD